MKKQILVKCANDECLRLDECVPNPNNPRTIKRERLDALKDQLKRLGIIKPAIVDVDNIILGGNMRHKALGELQEEGYDVTFPVSIFDGTEEERKLIVLADNNDAGDWDIPALSEYVADFELTYPDTNFSLSGFTPEDLVDLGAIPEETAVPPQDTDEDAIPDVVVKNPVTKRGDVWELGRSVWCPKCNKRHFVD